MYLEHAHHQHVYEDSHDDSWGSSGSYWKRSLPIDSNSAENVPVPVASASSDRINVNYNRPVASAAVAPVPIQSAPIPKQAPATYSASASNYRPTSYDEYNANGQLATYNDPHSIVYSQQMPQQTYNF